MDSGWAGGIAGGILGLTGGVIGTYFGVKNTSRPRGARLMIRLAAFGWLWLAATMAWLLLMRRPWNRAAMLLNLPILLSIPRGNRALAHARAEDESAG